MRGRSNAPLSISVSEGIKLASLFLSLDATNYISFVEWGGLLCGTFSLLLRRGDQKKGLLLMGFFSFQGGEKEDLTLYPPGIGP